MVTRIDNDCPPVSSGRIISPISLFELSVFSVPSVFEKYLRLVWAGLVVVLACLNVGAQEAPASNHVGSLSELRDKQRALLVVFKSRVIDVNNNERAIIDDVLKGDRTPQGRFAWVYNDLAGKLNKYINKHQSMSSARNLADAEYVIFFNVVEFRRILNARYAYGELFVIVKGSPKNLKPPRIVWRAKKVLIATDAIGDLIKDLKTLRGET
jgi:hypothetical protein